MSNIVKFFALLAQADTEENVITAYQRLLGASAWPRPFACDGLVDGTLFEFKYDKHLEEAAGMTVLAQACYYVHHIYSYGVYKKTAYPMPARICIADVNEAFVVSVETVMPFIRDDIFDWSRPPSSPDPKLVKVLAGGLSPVVYDMTDAGAVTLFVDRLAGGDKLIKQPVNVSNVFEIFSVWRGLFTAKWSPQEAVQAFLIDLRRLDLALDPQRRQVVFFTPEGKSLRAAVDTVKYQAFWDAYDVPPSNEEYDNIVAIKDRLVTIQSRRVTGEFFTPPAYAELGHRYLRKALGRDTAIYWDMAAGTGNLLQGCPSGAKIWASTLEAEDVVVLKESGYHAFQFDFLNQGFDELPEELLKDLNSGRIFVFLLNPPFAAGTSGEAMHSGGVARKGINTTVKGCMKKRKLGHACQNLDTQFLYQVTRLVRRFHLNAKLALFSKARWINGNVERFREDVWAGVFHADGKGSGFVFPAKHFHGTSGKWPVLFTLWETYCVDEYYRGGFDHIMLDVVDGLPPVKVGRKLFGPVDGGQKLSRWVKRPKGTVITLPMKGALEVFGGKVRVDRISEGAVGYLVHTSNDVYQNNVCQLCSAAYHHGDGWSITLDNFEHSMVCFAARKAVQQTWLNNQDEYTSPINPPQEFINDCVIYGLFHGSNVTSSLDPIEYKGEIHELRNHFFWESSDAVANAPGLPRPVYSDAKWNPHTPLFVEWWRKADLSSEASAVLLVARELLRVSAPFRASAEPKYQLHRWDAGWYQLRMGLKEFPEVKVVLDKLYAARKVLELKVRTQVYGLDMLPTTLEWEK